MTDRHSWDSARRPSSATSDEVQDLCVQLRHLTEELQSLQTNLKETGRQSQMLGSSQSLHLWNDVLARSDTPIPRLPPRRQRAPLKPQRTFSEQPICEEPPVEKRQQPAPPYPYACGPPGRPPKSPLTLEKMGNFPLTTARPGGGSASSSSPPSTAPSDAAALSTDLSCCSADDTDDLGVFTGPPTAASLAAHLQRAVANGTFWLRLPPAFLSVYGGGVPRHGLQQLIDQVYADMADLQTQQAIIINGVIGSGKTSIRNEILQRLSKGLCEMPESRNAFEKLMNGITTLTLMDSAPVSANTTHVNSCSASLCEVHVGVNGIHRIKLTCCPTAVVRLTGGRDQESKQMNFCIFYDMLAGLTGTEKVKYHLNGRSAASFRYLPQLTENENPCGSGERFEGWKTALRSLGIPLSDILRILSAILLLGNADFGDGGGEERRTLDSVAALLGVAPVRLRRALLHRSQLVGGETVTCKSTAQSVSADRHLLARTLYWRSFAAILRRVNFMPSAQAGAPYSLSDYDSAIDSEEYEMAATNGIGANLKQTTSGVVRILESVGFSDDAEVGGFEELCRNFAAERVHAFARAAVLDSAILETDDDAMLAATEVENGEPENAGLNQIMRVFELIEATTTDNDLPGLETYNYNGENCTTQSVRATGKFTIRHYGDATHAYDSSLMATQNKTCLRSQLTSLFDAENCNFGFLSFLFSPSFGHSTRPKTNRTIDERNSGSFCDELIGQLDCILNRLHSSQCRFIYCVQAPVETGDGDFLPVIQRQLPLIGSPQFLCHASSGFPYKHTLSEFIRNYSFLASRFCHDLSHNMPEMEAAQIILDSYLRAVDEGNLPYVPNQWSLSTGCIWLSQGANSQLRRLKQTHVQPPSVASDTTADARSGNRRRYRPRPFVEITSQTSDLATPVQMSLKCAPLPLRNMQSKPPALPKPRQYCVRNGKKLMFPQRRLIVAAHLDAATGAEFLPSDMVTVLGYGDRTSQVLVDCGAGTTALIPATATRLASD